MAGRLPGRFCLFVAWLALLGCSQQDTVKLGFIGGLSGAISDLGAPARNGFVLAIEQANAEGGIHGQKIEALLRDDRQDARRAQAMVKELIGEGVAAIIGPVTSSIAVAVAEQATAAEIVMMGVTVTTDELSGRDDYFLRVLASSRTHASEVADYVYRQGLARSFSAITDQNNASYSTNWVTHFSQHFATLGGVQERVVGFPGGDQASLMKAVQSMPPNSELVLLVTSALDAAMLAKLLRERLPAATLVVAEWASTERLVELGGRHVENILAPQYIDRDSDVPAVADFRRAYENRFNTTPGFPSMIAYDATRAVLAALTINPDVQQLKHTLISQSRFAGLHAPIVIDRYGDGQGATFITRIKNGRYRAQDTSP